MAERLASRKRQHDGQLRPKSWFDLDNKLLDNICSFLPPQDQINMNEAFYTEERRILLPSRWKIFHFRLDESELTSKDTRATDITKKYGKFFKRVYIDFPELVSDQLYTGWMGHFFIFMQMLAEKSRLIVIYFKNLRNCLRKFGDPWDKHTCMAIADFLASQSTLKTVSFFNNLLEHSDGIKILREIFENNLDITGLRFKEFLDLEDKYPEDLKGEEILTRTLSLRNLKILEIDHSLILGPTANASQVYAALKNHQKQLILKIFMLPTAASIHYKRLTTEQWLALKDENPNLYVDVALKANSTFKEETEWLVVPHTPIKEIIYSLNPSLNRKLEDMDRFLSECHSQEYLKIVQVTISREIGYIHPLSRFLKTCRKLETFKLVLTDSIKCLKFFLMSIRCVEPDINVHLKRIYIQVLLVADAGIPEIYLSELEKNKQQYAKERGITLSYEIFRFLPVRT